MAVRLTYAFQIRIHIEATVTQSWAADYSDLVEHLEGLPLWWSERGNRLLILPGGEVPSVSEAGGCERPSGSLIALRTPRSGISSIALGGDAARVYIGDQCNFGGLGLACLDGGSINIEGRFSTGSGCSIDCRNGGGVWIGEYGLWGNSVRIVTDDMHSILDLVSGSRINKFGSEISIDRHVWLGLETLVMPGAHIGESSVVGARSTVSGSLPKNSLCAGAPARVLRENVSWHIEDNPPEAWPAKP